MAAEMRNQYYQDNRRSETSARRQTSRLYVEGNTVRKEYEYERRHVDRREVENPRVRRNREKARHMTMPYVLLLLAATIITLTLCYQYLQLQSSIANHRRDITRLQASLSSIQQENAATSDSIDIYSDLAYIYSIATTELGMVYPSEDQVIEYDKSESEFVRQYDEIPTMDE